MSPTAYFECINFSYFGFGWSYVDTGDSVSQDLRLLSVDLKTEGRETEIASVVTRTHLFPA